MLCLFYILRGVLVFDNKDIHLQATYIWVKALTGGCRSSWLVDLKTCFVLRQELAIRCFRVLHFASSQDGAVLFDKSMHTRSLRKET